MNEQKILSVLVNGLKDYCRKNNFSKAILGISGGVDSALTATIAVRALGRENVLGVLMPSKYTSELSKSNARLLARNLGIKLIEVPIQEVYDTYIRHLKAHFRGTRIDKTEQNLQARIRANVLMAFSNKFGYLVLATGNKSEAMVGYATLYGDAAGGIAPIGNLYKRDVYNLANYINRTSGKEVIPESVISRAPTAELKPNQKDEDDIPSYDVLDEVLFLLDSKMKQKDIVKKGFDSQTVDKVAKMIKASEFKRSQSPKALPLR
ncbi:MAG TPA: NAD(+) synthase [Candidatus Nanoarchaeia archaeon]|nr:NAD(+) synthase [Candidatus Nanoarchaeia archaeon]